MNTLLKVAASKNNMISKSPSMSQGSKENGLTQQVTKKLKDPTSPPAPAKIGNTARAAHRNLNPPTQAKQSISNALASVSRRP